MTVKTITVTKEAYMALAGDKKADESFSEVILRTHGKRGSWETASKFIGAWEHIPDKVTESMKKDINKLNKHSMKSVAKKIRGI